MRSSPRTAWRTTAKWRRAWACPRFPVVAETIALSTMLQLARETGVKLHVCRISSAEGVEMVRTAKRQGLAVTCDVSMNHVHLSEMDIGFFDANCHLMPPLRSLRDKAALRAGLLDGTIDAICSNHSPVDEDAKQLPFAEAEAGATGMELLLPLVLKWAEEDKVPLPDALARVTINPAQLLGVKMGHLSVGAHADVCVFDPAGDVEGRACRAEEPGQEHAVQRLHHARPGATHHRRRSRCIFNLGC